MLDADHMITGIDMQDFAGDAPRHGRKQKGGTFANLFNRYRAPQRRIIFVPFENIAKIADAGRGEGLDRPGRFQLLTLKFASISLICGAASGAIMPTTW